MLRLALVAGAALLAWHLARELERARPVHAQLQAWRRRHDATR